MFNKKLYMVVLVLAVALSACSGVTPIAAQTESGDEVAQEQASPESGNMPEDQPVHGQGPQGEAGQDGREGGPRGGKDGQGGRPQLDLAAAAETLGVSEEDLKAAFTPSEEGKPELAAVAESLGVTEEELVAALGIPAGREDGQRHPEIDLAAAATTLGVSEEDLQTALRESADGKKPDFAVAAETLGVTEEALKDALGVPAEAPMQDAPQQEDAPTSAQG